MSLRDKPVTSPGSAGCWLSGARPPRRSQPRDAERSASRISSGVALSPASSDMWDQTTRFPGAITIDPPSCAGCPIVRPCVFPVRKVVIRPFASDSRPEQFAHRRDLRAGGLVALALLVGEHRQLDPLTTAEVRGVPGRQLADQYHIRACGLELLPGAIQLDRVRATVNSAVVAQPDQRRRAIGP